MTGSHPSFQDVPVTTTVLTQFYEVSGSGRFSSDALILLLGVGWAMVVQTSHDGYRVCSDK